MAVVASPLQSSGVSHIDAEAIPALVQTSIPFAAEPDQKSCGAGAKSAACHGQG